MDTDILPQPLAVGVRHLFTSRHYPAGLYPTAPARRWLFVNFLRRGTTLLSVLSARKRINDNDIPTVDARR
ncbi:hypothetical protein TNCV_3023091, partial [Trichonephila clavipes]